MANESGAINLDDLDAETKARVAGMAEQHGETLGHVATTAFLVIINPDNSVMITADANYDVTLQRMATASDIKHGLVEGLDSLRASQIAGVTQAIMMQTAQAMQQQAQASGIVKNLGDLRSGR